MNQYLAILRRDLYYYATQKGQWGFPLAFFVLLSCVFPMAFDLTEQNIAMLGIGVIWVGAILASYLSLEGLFRQDIECGVFEQYFLSSANDTIILYMKLFAHWLAFALPLILLTPFVGVLFQLELRCIGVLILFLLAGTPILTTVGWFGLAVITTLPRGQLLLAILILPLSVPVLILGTVSGQYAIKGLPILGLLALMIAFLLLSLLMLPWVTMKMIRLSLAT